MADSGAAPGADDQHGGGPAEGPSSKLNISSAEGIGVSTSEGQGAAQTPSEPQSGLFDIPHLEGTGASEGLGIARTPIGPSSRGSSRPGIGRRPLFPDRPVPSATSGTSVGTHGSRARRPTVLNDIYYDTPDIPTWVGEDDTQEYASWTAETENQLKSLLDEVTKSPRDGMLERVDPDGLLRGVVQSVDSAVFHSRWERLLHCYDTAMSGKCAALRAIAGALRKAEESQDQAVQLKGTMRSFFDEKKILDRSIAQLEGENSKQQKEITTLERTNGVLHRDRSTLQTKFAQVCTAREKDLEVLEGVISSWESLTGTALGSASDGEADYDTRFDSILEALKEARASTTLTESQNKRLKEQKEALEEKVYNAEHRPKSQQGPSAAQLDLESWVGKLELRNQDLERELLEARAQATKPQESPAKSAVSQASQSEQQLGLRESEDVDPLEEEVALYKDRCEVLQRTVDELRQQLDDAQAIQATLDRISEGIENTNAIHLEQSQQLSDEVKRHSRDPGSSVQDLGAMDEDQESINRELDMLRNQSKSNHQAFQEIRQQIRQQRGRVSDAAETAASSSSQHRRTSEARSPDHLPDSLGSGPEGLHRAGPHEIKYLDGARKLIEELKPNLRKESGPETAIRGCLGQLSTLLAELSTVDPHTPTEGLVRALDGFLKESLKKGIRSNMLSGFLSTLEKHDKGLTGLFELERFTPKESSAERELLEGIRHRVNDTELFQRNQARTIQDCEELRARRARLGFSREPSEDLLKLCNRLLDTTDGEWTEEDVRGPLVAQAQKLIASPEVDAQLQLVRQGLGTQKARLAELGDDMTKLWKLVDATNDQIEALSRLRAKRRAPVTPEVSEMDAALEATLRRRDMRLRRERAYARDCYTRLEGDMDRSQAFLDSAAASDARRAEMLASEACIKRDRKLYGRHSKSCFCSLMGIAFPDAYAWCCSAAATSAPTGHGHIGLPHTWPYSIWTIVCTIMTAIIWFLLLVLIQPRNFLTTLTFLLALLVRIPVYLFARLTRRQPPNLIVPPAETLVGAAITTSFFYYGLSYIAVVAERRLWVGASDWRYAYVLDLISGKPLPYGAWSPVRVDSRLVFDPVWVWVSEKVHGLFHWGEEAAVAVLMVLGFWMVAEGLLKMGQGAVEGWWGKGTAHAAVPPLQEAGRRFTYPLGPAPGSRPPAGQQETPLLDRAPVPQAPAEHQETPPVEPEPEVDPLLKLTQELFAGLTSSEDPKGAASE